MEKRISKRIRGIPPNKVTPVITIRRHKIRANLERQNSDPTYEAQDNLAATSSKSFSNYREPQHSESDTEEQNLLKIKENNPGPSSVVIASPKLILKRRHSVGNYSFVFEDTNNTHNS